MKTTVASPEYAVQAGDLWECPDDQLAHKLVEDGGAEEVQAEIVEMVSTFHGGLKAANRPMDELTGEVPPNPTMSTAKEAAQVTYPIDRRTADEMAADARLDAAGAIISKDPEPVKTANQRALEEAEAKIAQATAAPVDPKASAHEAKIGFRSPKAAPPPKTEPPKAEPPKAEPVKTEKK